MLSSCIRNVYGETYPIPDFYDPSYIRDSIEARKLYSVVAINKEGQIVGNLSTILEKVGDFTADGSALMVSREYRGQGILWKLGEKMAETYQDQGIAGLHLYALALHDIVQNQSQNAGAVVTGILPGYFSRKVKASGYEYPDARIGSVTLYMPLAPLPKRASYIPDVYSGVLSDTYVRLGLDRDLIAADEKPFLPAKTSYFIDSKAANKHLRVVIKRIGMDLIDVVRQHLPKLAPPEYEVVYLDLPLSDPAVGYAVENVRQLRFFYGALMIERCGSDWLRLQRYDRHLVAPEAMKIASEVGANLLSFILSDSRFGE